MGDCSVHHVIRCFSRAEITISVGRSVESLTFGGRHG